MAEACSTVDSEFPGLGVEVLDRPSGHSDQLEAIAYWDRRLEHALVLAVEQLVGEQPSFAAAAAGDSSGH